MPANDNQPSRSLAEGLADSIQNFSDSLDALRDFVVLIQSLLSERQRKLMRLHRRELALLVLAVRKWSGEAEASQGETDKLKRKLGFDINVVSHEQGVIISVPDKATAEKTSKLVKEIMTESRHQGLLYRSTLISLVSSAEWFLSQLIREYFQSYENAIGLKEKVLSLQDLQNFGSIGDAKEFLIDSRVDEIMRGSFEDWLKFFRETVKISASYLNPQKDQLVEVFQRRNVMVHNNGLVHSSYINKVAESLRKGVGVGDELSVPSEYLQLSIDLMERNFLLLGIELWKHLAPKDDKRGRILVDIAFQRLTQEHWTVAEGLSFFLKNDKQVSENYQVMGLLNYWQSMKWQGRFSEVQDEIAAADFTAKDELYQIARYALLDDVEQFRQCFLSCWLPANWMETSYGRGQFSGKWLRPPNLLNLSQGGVLSSC